MHPIYPIPSVFFKPEAIWFSGISYVPLAVLSVGGTICVVILEEEHDYIQQFHYAKYDLDTIHAWNTNFSPTNETGSFSLLNLGQFFPVHLRQIALYLWCSFTMAVNLIVFFVDETNYKEEERKEILKEEKRKKREEERRKREKWDEDEHEYEKTFSRRTRIIISLTVYALLSLFFGWFSYKMYQDVIGNMESSFPYSSSTESFSENAGESAEL